MFIEEKNWKCKSTIFLKFNTGNINALQLQYLKNYKSTAILNANRLELQID